MQLLRIEHEIRLGRARESHCQDTDRTMRP